MPPSNEPVRHRFSELPSDRPMDLLERRRVIGEKVMISEVRLAKGCVVPAHRHENEQMCVVLEGRLRFGFGENATVVDVAAGEVLTLPSNVLHSAEAIVDSRVLDVFAPPSATTGIDARAPGR